MGGVKPGADEEEQLLNTDQQRELKGQALQEVEAAIDRELQTLGFEKRTFPEDLIDFGIEGCLYTREINSETLGLVRWGDIDTSDSLIPEVTVFVGVRNQRLEKAMAEERKETFHPYWPPSMRELEIGEEVVGTRARIYRFKEREQVEKVAKRLAADVQKHALPFMEAHGSLATLRARAAHPPRPRWLPKQMTIGSGFNDWWDPKEDRAAVAWRLFRADQA